jgi:hypothetical protein
MFLAAEPTDVDADGRVDGRSARSVAGMVLGAVLALAVPLSQVVVAFLWDRGIVQLEPNGPFVQFLQAAAGFEFAVGPLGVVILGRSASLRGVLAWAALFVVAVPVLAFLWFVGVASLGGLAGEPF